MSDQMYTIGERVEKICPKCNKQLGHVVKSVTRLGKISRVICSKCGLTGTFKKTVKTSLISDSGGKVGAPYDRTKNYHVGQMLLHSTFGAGEVIKVFNTKTIDVLFADRVRRLIHSQI
ncbi:MAG: hypothetical protein R2747_10655 [Pyrinomonadaceae bacterium]